MQFLQSLIKREDRKVERIMFVQMWLVSHENDRLTLFYEDEFDNKVKKCETLCKSDQMLQDYKRGRRHISTQNLKALD
jgi:hypothetical protein